jgi:hypothetical protein
MKFTISATGVTYELVQSKVTFAEARAIERVTGHTFTEITNNPELRDSTDVIQAMIWISMKRDEPTLTFSDLDDIEIDGIEWSSEDDDVATPDPTQEASSSPVDVESEPDQTSPQSD